MTPARPRALVADPCLDPDRCEEELHASLRRGGWNDRTLFWRATLLARAVAWVNHLRAAGEPSIEALRVMGEARRMVRERQTEITQEQDPAWPEYRDLLPEPDRRIPHGGGFPESILRPPSGWMVSDE